MKWFQFQLNRNSLFTNYKVNKFKPQISKYCSYCSHIEGFSHLEVVSHLFFDCDFVLKLWQEKKTWLATLNINIPLDRNKLIFGIHDEAIFSPTNYVILCTKYFIWRTKFLSKDLSLGLFHRYLFAKLNDQRNAFIYSGKMHQFNQMNVIYNCLSRLPGCSAQNEAPLPDQVLTGRLPPDPVPTT